MNEVLYQFALDSTEKLINIRFVKHGEKYFCPGCKNEMIAKCGATRQHHFSHKPISELNDKERNSISDCINSNESYLHNTFKIGLYQILKAKIEANEEFIIHWNASNIGKQNRNLLKIAKDIKIENYVDELKPDITLYDKSGRAYVAIEVVVNHKPDKKKLAYYSENKITLYEIDLDKNNFDVLNNITLIASNPTVFSFIPDPKIYSYIPESRICTDCGEQTFFSYINITKVNCPYCKAVNRFAFRSTTNKNKKDVIYKFDRYSTITEKNIFDIHGLLYDKTSSKFICENCTKDIFIAIGDTKEKITYPLGYFCPNCQGKIKSLTYKNQKFQNRAEIKWAEFFDTEGIKYEYNPKEYRYSDINPFPVFYLKDSQQLFRANRYEHSKKDLDKGRILSAKAGLDTIFGLENGNFHFSDESEEETFLAQCRKCKTYYFTTLNIDWTCKHCGYYDGDSTYYYIANGANEIFDDEDDE